MSICFSGRTFNGYFIGQNAIKRACFLTEPFPEIIVLKEALMRILKAFVYFQP